MGSGQSKVSFPSKEIVIVGGGYGGSYLAYKLVTGRIGNVTLIEPKEGVFHNIGAPRLAVDASYANKIVIPFTGKLQNCHVRAKATSIDIENKTVHLDNGDSVNYTDLIIATGASSPFPGKLGMENPAPSTEEIIKLYSDFRSQLEVATNVVLVGGGAVGVEIAGEIKTDFPNIQVTIINSRDVLVSNNGTTAFQNSLQNSISKKGIKVLLNERVANMNDLTLNQHKEQIVKTESGKEISCDFVIPCTGTAINNSCYRDQLGKNMNENGSLQVDEFLRVKDQENIFAIGDITDVKEEKMAYTAKLQADAVFSTLKGNPKKYTPADFGMLVPLGRNGGIAYFKGMTFGSFLAKKLKSGDMFASMMWKDLGAKPSKTVNRKSTSV